MTVGPVKVLQSIPLARGVSILIDVRTYIRKDGKITPSVCMRVGKRRVEGRLGNVGDDILKAARPK